MDVLAVRIGIVGRVIVGNMRRMGNVCWGSSRAGMGMRLGLAQGVISATTLLRIMIPMVRRKRSCRGWEWVERLGYIHGGSLYTVEWV